MIALASGACLINFSARFVQLVGLDQREVGPRIELKADDREGAISEASALPRPLGANYIKVSEGDQIISWIAL